MVKRLSSMLMTPELFSCFFTSLWGAILLVRGSAALLSLGKSAFSVWFSSRRGGAKNSKYLGVRIKTKAIKKKARRVFLSMFILLGRFHLD